MNFPRTMAFVLATFCLTGAGKADSTYADLGVDPAALNGELRPADPAVLLDWLGQPAAAPGTECTPPDAAFAARTGTVQVGSGEAVLLAQAAQSLAAVLARVATEAPDLYASLQLGGALCIRTLQGGGPLAPHSFGTAIDIAADGLLDAPGDGKTAAALAALARYMTAAGWYWGAALPSDEPMHFEASDRLVAEWIAAGN